MTSLTHSALFCGLFTLFFLETRSELISNATIAPVHSVPPPPAEVTPPPAADVKNVTTSAGSTLSSTDKTRSASEKLFTQNVSGTERSEHRDTFSAMTTARESEVNTTAETISAGEKSNASLKSENTTLTPVSSNQVSTAPPVMETNLTTMFKKTAQMPANMTALPVAPESPALTTSFTPITNISMSETATTLPENTTSASASTVKYSQNATNGEFNQSSATTETATNQSVRTDHTEMTKNTTKLLTTESPIRNQSTTLIHTTAFVNISSTSADISTENASISVTTNATGGGWIPVVTKKVPTSTPNPTTTKVPETTQTTEAQPCASRRVATQCLIVIASLAVVATIFMISTIVLCTKLSSRKYRFKRQQQGTEMMCISSLMPERSNHRPVRYTRQRSPVPNGVLVIHNGDDSDDDVGDNLTLSSFLPENDRYV